MTLKEQINADFLTAFKAKEMTKKNFLGLLKGEIQNAELRGIPSTDENVLSVLKKMEKSLKQTNTDESLSELEYLNPYLPQLMSGDEILAIIKECREKGLTSVGQIMGAFNKDYKGKADNQLVSKLIALPI
jgi:uncharacterized protein YqeY